METTLQYRILIVVMVMFFTIVEADESVAVVRQDSRVCHTRSYTYLASQPYVNKFGEVLHCNDTITVNSCWGSCLSQEIPDYRLPYRVSEHPVCTFDETRVRAFLLRNCHPDHPDPFHITYEAVSCRCKKCDSKTTLCQ